MGERLRHSKELRNVQDRDGDGRCSVARGLRMRFSTFEPSRGASKVRGQAEMVVAWDSLTNIDFGASI